ncbi:serine/threonine protein kinase [Kitasatospora sp. RB6PN24]|uniref:serine/threonine protein kinase n=1 Tax=Kitasatospora humi TaxID=2893891 RepID=UPI001E4C66E6|nr:serine/threonine protein kinase [Kitasatospora humi]MCC9308047.1 serine/threonine protein kinase [Kitasatospora humi]
MADRTTDRTEAAVDMSTAEATGEITAPLPTAEAVADLTMPLPAADPSTDRTVPLPIAEATAELTMPLPGAKARARTGTRSSLRTPGHPAAGRSPGKAPAKAPTKTAAAAGTAAGKSRAAGPGGAASKPPVRPQNRTAAERAAERSVERAVEATGEITAPLSATEIAAELAQPAGPKTAGTAPSAASEPAAAPGPAAPAAVPPRSTDEPSAPGKPSASGAPSAAPGTPPATDDALPEQLPAPVRQSGDRIAGRYRLEECITQSAAFSSWRAVDEMLRRAVGVHLIAAGSRRADAVLAAARSAALLGDPRFVQVLDAVREGELVYVIREWLPDATDLATMLAAGPLAPHEAYQMARQVTDAIAAAHRGGRSHLRLTPRAVLRTDTGQYRINGVAVDAALRGLSAPEDRAAAELADTRAIGTLLYAALTHRWPQPEDRYQLRGLPDGVPAPEVLRPDAPPTLCALAARILCTPGTGPQAPITTPAALAKAIAALPKIHQPEGGPNSGDRSAHRYPPGQTVGRTPAAPAGAPRTRQPRPAPGGPVRPAPVRPAPMRPAPDAVPGHPAPRPVARRGKRVLTWAVSAVVLAAIGYGSWQLAGTLGATGTSSGPTTLGSTVSSQPPSNGPTSAAPPVGPLTISDVTSFNPYGGTPTHPNQLALSHDGNPQTAWTTEGYHDDLPTIGHGNGLLVDLGAVKSVSSVEVQFLGGATGVSLQVPKDTSGTTAPTRYEDFAAPLAKATDSDAKFPLSTPVRTRYLLIWLTSLPKDGDSYRGQVAEIKVTG